MALLIPNASERYLLDKLRTAFTWTIKLYSSNTTPSATSVLSDFTLAANMTTATVSWSAAATDGSGVAYLVPATLPIALTYSGSVDQDINGYVLVDGSQLVAAEKWSTAITVHSSGDKV